MSSIQVTLRTIPAVRKVNMIEQWSENGIKETKATKTERKIILGSIPGK